MADGTLAGGTLAGGALAMADGTLAGGALTRGTLTRGTLTRSGTSAATGAAEQVTRPVLATDSRSARCSRLGPDPARLTGLKVAAQPWLLAAAARSSRTCGHGSTWAHGQVPALSCSGRPVAVPAPHGLLSLRRH
jgi:hypothetical protein